MQAMTVAICSEVGTNNHNYSNRRSSDDSNRVVVLITDIIKIVVRLRIVKSGGTYPNASVVGKKKEILLWIRVIMAKKVQ